MGPFLVALCVLPALPLTSPADDDVMPRGYGAFATRSGRSPDDVRALTDTIDTALARRWALAGVAPAPPATDAEFLRRVSLDIIGRIPTVAEARRFFDDTAPDKRTQLVERLISGHGYASHAADVWKGVLIPERPTDRIFGDPQTAFVAWLRQRLSDDGRFDQLVRDLLTAPADRTVRVRRFDEEAEPSPYAFYIMKGAKPENLAASTARVFLGIRLECAQCHDHPFGTWKREEFWGLASFFAGFQDDDRPAGIVFLREDLDRRELTIPGTKRKVRATFLGARDVVRERKTVTTRGFFGLIKVTKPDGRQLGL